MKLAIKGLVLLLVLLGCKRETTAEFIHVDDELDLSPTARFWTASRLSIISHSLDEYRRVHGRLPVQLDDLCIPDGRLCSYQRPEKWVRDPWCTPIRYRVTADSIELRSAGPDTVFNTADDLLLDNPSPADIKQAYFANDSVERDSSTNAFVCRP